MTKFDEIIKECSPYVTIETFQNLYEDYNIISITSGGKVIEARLEDEDNE